MPAQRPLVVLLKLIFVLATVSGCLVVFGGAAALPGIQALAPTADAEMRFLAVPWLAYGFFAQWVARDLGPRLHFVPAVGWVLLASAAARGLSWSVVGPPHALSVVAIAVELIGGGLALFWHRRATTGGAATLDG